ncbi:MAG: hypothetical protein ACI865_000719 [Flavobacteriaceae bacterium]|jgi:uncharacterized protein YxeA
MKILKKLLFVVVALLAIILITALFVKKDYTVARSVEIKSNVSDVYDYLSQLENQQEFSVWQAKDPKTKNSSKGKDGTVGYIHSWSSKHEEVGVGEQEIMKMEIDKRIDFALRFKEPMELDATAYMTTEEKGDRTKVTWTFEGSRAYPFNVFFLFMDMDETLGPDLQKGLNNLKEILESKD